MAITAYVGLPGSGKSYSVVENVILPALRQGVIVFTNIPMNRELIDREFGGLLKQFDTQDLLDNPHWFQEVFLPGATLVLDECWRVWSAGTRANKLPEEHKSFLAEHRHMVGESGRSTEVVLVTQDLSQIASYPRSLVESTFRTVKLVAVGATNRFRVDVYSGAVTGNQPPKSQLLRQIPGKYKAEVYQYYTSQTMSEAEGHGDETRTDDRNNILKSPFFRFLLPGLAVAVVLVVYQGYHALRAFYGFEDADPGPEVPTSDYRPPEAPQEAPKPAPKKVSQFWDGLSAFISFNMGRHVRDIQYLITFTGDTGTVTLGEGDLYRLGYQLEKISPCLVRIHGNGGSLTVLCQPEQEKKDWSFSL